MAVSASIPRTICHDSAIRVPTLSLSLKDHMGNGVRHPRIACWVSNTYKSLVIVGMWLIKILSIAKPLESRLRRKKSCLHSEYKNDSNFHYHPTVCCYNLFCFTMVPIPTRRLTYRHVCRQTDSISSFSPSYGEKFDLPIHEHFTSDQTSSYADINMNFLIQSYAYEE